MSLILKWKAADYDTVEGRREIKAHYDNVQGAYNIDSSSKESVRKKLISKALDHLKGMLRDLGFVEKRGANS